MNKFVKRSDVGYEKYGRTLDNERRGKHKDLAGYLNDIQEELMDAVLYIQAAREELDDQITRSVKESKDYSRKKGPVRAKKVSFDGINFASGLEKYMYVALKEAKIKSEYEGKHMYFKKHFHLTQTLTRGKVTVKVI